MVDALALLIAGHAIADYPLQGDFLAKAKNRFAPIPGVPWYQALGAHAVIHGGLVLAITGSLTLGLAEIVSHFLIDDAKCAGRISYNTDQSLHIACKVAWALALYAVIAP
jgi:hypothetical protein